MTGGGVGAAVRVPAASLALALLLMPPLFPFPMLQLVPWCVDLGLGEQQRLCRHWGRARVGSWLKPQILQLRSPQMPTCLSHGLHEPLHCLNVACVAINDAVLCIRVLPARRLPSALRQPAADSHPYPALRLLALAQARPRPSTWMARCWATTALTRCAWAPRTRQAQPLLFFACRGLFFQLQPMQGASGFCALPALMLACPIAIISPFRRTCSSTTARAS